MGHTFTKQWNQLRLERREYTGLISNHAKLTAYFDLVIASTTVECEVVLFVKLGRKPLLSFFLKEILKAKHRQQ